ncbi:cell adhesion molecule 2-like isoform X1 [Petromyzon marinus]|uniref:Cell adhesion molecule 2-like isoform X1 n=1 Tax=Petromyzon marinus TaxID=7757 RepID=A0AAJ7UHT9_PETMA|nr:cell adhesion molecule 2-like isoform X1 [Petromyzon marinus]
MMGRMRLLLLCSSLCAVAFPHVESQKNNNKGHVRAWANRNGTLVEGEELQLSCHVDHTDGSPIQWSNPAQQTLFFENKKALKDVRIELVRHTHRELHISVSNVTLSDEGDYTCALFTRPIRLASTYVTILVPPKQPVMSSIQGPIEQGDRVRLTCRTRGSKPVANIRWFRGNKEIEAGETTWEVEENGRTSSLVSHVEFLAAPEDDGAPVTCQVEHPALRGGPPLRSHRSLEVLYKPIINIIASSRSVREGDKLELICNATSKPSPERVQWVRVDGEMPERANVSGTKLLLAALNKTDNGTYRCEASNRVGSSTDEYTLVVQDHPNTIHPTASFPAAKPTRADMVPLAARGADHAVVGGVVAVAVFATLCLLVILGRYLARHKGTYLTNEAKGAEGTQEADTPIVGADGVQNNTEEKKEYFI